MAKFKSEKDNIKDSHEVNWRIKNRTLQVIDDNGVNRGEMSKASAITIAEEAGLDLVKVGDRGDVGVAKIMDFGKFLYSKKKQQAEAKKHQKVILIKEVKMRPSIDIGDYTTKIKRAASFLEEGKHVKFTVLFRGRQPVSTREVGEKFFDRIKNDLMAAGLDNLVEEKESRSRMVWSKVFFVKEKK